MVHPHGCNPMKAAPLVAVLFFVYLASYSCLRYTHSWQASGIYAPVYTQLSPHKLVDRVCQYLYYPAYWIDYRICARIVALHDDQDQVVAIFDGWRFD